MCMATASQTDRFESMGALLVSGSSSDWFIGLLSLVRVIALIWFGSNNFQLKTTLLSTKVIKVFIFTKFTRL